RPDARCLAGDLGRAAPSVQPPARLPIPSALPRCDGALLRRSSETRAGDGESACELLPAPRQGRGRMSEPVLEVRGLQKFFPITEGFFQRTVGHVRAVDGVDFTLNEGETLGLVGESGCGKTTASRCILRAIDPTGGEILYRTRAGSTVDLAT